MRKNNPIVPPEHYTRTPIEDIVRGDWIVTGKRLRSVRRVEQSHKSTCRFPRDGHIIVRRYYDLEYYGDPYPPLYRKEYPEGTLVKKYGKRR